MFFWLTLLVGTAAAAKERPAQLPDVTKLRKAADKGALTGKIEVKFRNARAPEPELLSKAFALAGAIECVTARPRRIFREAGMHEARHKRFGLHLWYELTCVEGGALPAEASAAALAAMTTLAVLPAGGAILASVAIVEPGYVAEPYRTSDDPRLTEQTHYDAISLFDAWDIVPGGTPSMVVQVIDTGLDMTHPEFDTKSNIWVNAGEDGNCDDGIDNDGNGFVDDCHGYNHANSNTEYLGDGSHGTHCSGTIGASTDNGVGVAGVAGGLKGRSGVSIMTSVVFGNSPPPGGFGEALVYGADNGARISSNSWGYTFSGTLDSTVKDGIDYAVAAGVVVVFAAGNSNSEADFYPGFYGPVVAVAALQDNGIRASFSNYGSWVDISGPGVNILSTVTDGEDYYSKYSGTSMACPHVSGLLALGLGANPTLANEKALACLYDTADGVDAINPAYAGKLGPGMINATAFVACVTTAQPTAEPTVTSEPSAEPSVEPTGAPTASMAPTAYGCGLCDKTLKIRLHFDDYPGDITWTLEMYSDSSKCKHDGASAGGPYAVAPPPQDAREEVVDTLCEDKTYTFAIYDAFGDGLCCTWGWGSYALVLEGVTIANGTDFGFHDEVSFTVGMDSLEDTAAPTVESTSSTDVAPTVKPTAKDVAPTAPMPSLEPTVGPTTAPTTSTPTNQRRKTRPSRRPTYYMPTYTPTYEPTAK